MYNCVSPCQWMGEEGIMDSVLCLEGDARKVQKKTKEIAVAAELQ